MFLYSYQIAIAIVCSFLLGAFMIYLLYLLYLLYKDKRLQKQKLIYRISFLEERLRDLEHGSSIQYNFISNQIVKLNKKVFKDEKN